MVRNSYFLVFYFSFVSFLWPLLNQYHAIYLADLVYATAIFNTVILMEFGFLFIARKIIEKSSHKKGEELKLDIITNLNYILVAVLLTLNFYYFCLILINIQFETKLLMLGIYSVLIYFLLFKEGRVKIALIFATIFLILSVLQLAITTSHQSFLRKETGEWKLEKYQSLVELKDKPNRRNIYMISFDSAVSPQSLRILYGSPELAHLQFLTDAGFKVLDSAFSAGEGTMESFFNMLRLEEEDAKFIRAFYSTRSLNPSYTLFEKAGYKIQFLYVHNYLGSNTNSLDYFYPEGRFIMLCDHIDQDYGFFACDRKILIPLNYRIFGTNIGFKTFYNKILERIKTINNSDVNDKWITIAHLYAPGHTPNNFRYTDISGKEKYIAEMIKKYLEVDRMIREIVTLIREVDNDPVIFIYADHGPFLTRGLDYDEENPLYTAEEIYLDKLGIMFAVYPDDFCASKFQEGYNTVNLIGDMLACENSR